MSSSYSRLASSPELEKEVRYADQQVEKAKAELERLQAYAKRQRHALSLAYLREAQENV